MKEINRLFGIVFIWIWRGRYPKQLSKEVKCLKKGFWSRSMKSSILEKISLKRELISKKKSFEVLWISLCLLFETFSVVQIENLKYSRRSERRRFSFGLGAVSRKWTGNKRNYDKQKMLLIWQSWAFKYFNFKTKIKAFRFDFAAKNESLKEFSTTVRLHKEVQPLRAKSIEFNAAQNHSRRNKSVNRALLWAQLALTMIFIQFSYPQKLILPRLREKNISLSRSAPKKICCDKLDQSFGMENL